MHFKRINAVTKGRNIVYSRKSFSPYRKKAGLRPEVSSAYSTATELKFRDFSLNWLPTTKVVPR